VELPIQDGLVDQTEKLEPFLVAMPFLAQAKDFAVGRIQRGKQLIESLHDGGVSPEVLGVAVRATLYSVDALGDKLPQLAEQVPCH
jgi:hypothetical protein